MSSATSSGWKKLCAEGRKSFRDRDIDGALKSFDEAIRLANDKSYVPYDTRADAYEKLNCFNYALRDAKKTIDIAPRQWQGYFRSARLLAALGQSEAAVTNYESHQRELTDLRQRLEAQPKCHVSDVPVELLLAIFKHSSNLVAISHVCQRWRNVTHSNSTLWSSLVLTAPPERALRKIQEWDERSRGQIVQAQGHPDDCAMYTKIVATLRHLDLTKLKEFHIDELYAELFLSALSDGTEIRPPTTGNPLDIESISLGERLGTSRLQQTAVGKPPRSQHQQWDGVTGKQLSTSIAPPYVLRFLRANAGLEKLVLEIVIDLPEAQNYYSFFTPLESLTLAHLRHLELKGTLPFISQTENVFVFPRSEYYCRCGVLDKALYGVTEGPWHPNDPKLVPTELPVLCPALSVLDLSRSPRLKTNPVMQIVKERIALAASQDGGRYQLPGEDGDRGVSCIRTLNVDECPHIEAEMLPWFQENVPEFSCRYDVKRKTRRSC
ncbi:hypothetical protein EDB89DRAFT_2245624 [Lactarius sanguifluus]|nr:hypothetical protein EDB89DRAFT_2245624 [Lactarius sanguifluus]